MKRIGLLLLLVVLACGSVWGEAVYKWDFEENGQSKDWQAINGNWIIENGFYKQKSNEIAAHTLAGNSNWDNYTVETKIRIDEGKWAGLIFRAQNQLEYYVFYLPGPDNKTEFWRHIKGGGFDARDRLQGNIPVVGGVKIKNGEWYKVRIDVNIDDFTFYINDIKQGVFQDVDRKYMNGGIGFWTWETKASFDDVVVVNGISIPDPNLRSALEQALGKNEGDVITKEDLAGLKELNAEGLSITDISMLKYTTSLAQLNLEDNQITDISPLIENTGISGTIKLKNNPLTNTALSTQIPALEARGITVEYDMPEGVVLFKDANLEKAIRDALGIPTELLKKEDLAGLTELKYEDKEGAKIADLTGLEHCTNLTKLELYYNQISEVSSLANLTNLTRLSLGHNQLSGISPLTNLTNLRELDLVHNQITDVSPLTKLTKLTLLYLNNNQISDISSLINLTNLTYLYLDNHQLTDLNPLANLTSLTELGLENNQLSDLRPLAKLTKLTRLYLQNNQISDISPLIENTGISGTINLKNNPLNNTALSTHIPALEARGIEVEYDMPEGVVLFKDANLEKAIRDALGIPTELLKKEDLAGLTELVVDGGAPWDSDSLTEQGQIKDLVGLEHCTGLTQLNLRNHQISDIKPLANLTNLTMLNLNYNQISNISPLNNLINLATLELWANRISDISSLTNLTNLRELELHYNQISDLSALTNLAKLTNLTSLDLANNQITDLSPLTNLANLTNLTALNLGNNQISDISTVANLTNLTSLDLYENQISDISPLTNLTNLTHLGLHTNQLTDLTGLTNLANLTTLYLPNNQIIDISPLANLTNLTGLYLGNNQISDISILSNLTKLTDLRLYDNKISDIAPLIQNIGISGTINLKNNPLSNTALSTHIPALQARGIEVEYDMPEGVVLFKDANLEKAIRDALGIPTELLKKEDLEKLEVLKYIGKEGAKIADLTGIEHCTGLKKLNLRNHQITDVSALATLTNLSNIELRSNQISDLSLLANLTNLTDLNFSDNQISDISPLANLTSLTGLSLYYNQISDINPLATLSKLTSLSLFGNPINDISPLANLTTLTSLEFYSNQLNDLSPLTNLTNLTYLNVLDNPISDISVLSNLTNLEYLAVSGTQISDITVLTNLIHLKILRFNSNLVSDIAPLANLTNLTSLSLHNNRLSDISSLAKLTKLTDLGLHNNQINDITPLIQNTGISGTISLKGNPLTNTAYASHIPALKARGITVEYDAPPADIIKIFNSDFETSLRKALNIPTETITVSNTSTISDLNLANIGVTDLDIEALKALPKLKTINLTNNPLSANAVLVQIPELESAGITVDLGTSAAAKVELTAEKSSIPASLASTTDITVTVTDASGRAVKRETVNLSVDQGTIQTPAVNNGDGTYTATYAAVDTLADVTISALISNGIFASIKIKLVGVSVSAAKSTIGITSSITPQTGEKATVVVTALSQEGLPLSGREVELKISPETKVVIDPSAKTDKEGKAELTFTTGKPEMKIIKASVDGIELSSSRAVMFTGAEIDLEPVAVAETVTAVATKTSLEADGESTSKLTITVLDVDGGALTDQKLQLEVENGTLGEVVNNNDGTYATTYIAGIKAGEVTITAKTSNNKVGTVKLTLTEKIEKPKLESTFIVSTLKEEKSGSAGEFVSYLVKLEGKDGFADKVTLFATDPPKGVEVTFAPKEVSLSAEEALQTSQMTLTLDKDVAAKDYEITALAKSEAGTTQELTVTVKVESADLAATSILLTVKPKELQLSQSLEIFGQLANISDTEVEIPANSVINLILTSPSDQLVEFKVNTAEDGNYQLATPYTPDEVGEWGISANFEGTKTLKASKRSIKFTVAKGTAVISFSNENSAALGSELELVGNLKPQLAEQTVSLKIIKPDGSVPTPTNIQTGELGVFTHRQKLNLSGNWEFTATWAGNDNYESVTKTLSVAVSSEVGKAILVLGGGDRQNNKDWRTFSSVAQHVYKVFLKRQFDADDDIHYLSPDLKSSQGADTVTTLDTLEKAITSWARKQVNPQVPLYIYLLSHNLGDKFLLEKSGNQEKYLSPQLLDTWLDTLPEGTPVTVVIEACYSGNFISSNGTPTALAGENRTIIVSARGDRQSKIARSSSFSRTFFSYIESNKPVGEAFDQTVRRMEKMQYHRGQHPEMDSNGDGNVNQPEDYALLRDRYLPADLISLANPPELTKITEATTLKKGISSLRIEVEVVGTNITHVYATVVPPTYDPTTEIASWSELEFDEFDLGKVSEGKYAATYANFTLAGDYAVIVNAENADGFADPIQTIITVAGEEVTKPKLAGDVNGDSSVNIFDLVMVAGQFGKSGAGLSGDVNGDSSVNIFDLVMVAGNFGKSAVAAAPTVLANKLTFTTQQKWSIQSAIVELEDMPVRSEAEELVLSVLIAILPERLPTETQLLPNYPNPFNPETWIPFELSQDGKVSITIYNVAGTPVRNISVGYLQAGSYVSQSRAVYWDGKTDAGERVSSGTYFCTLRTNTSIFTQKMIILK